MKKPAHTGFALLAATLGMIAAMLSGVAAAAVPGVIPGTFALQDSQQRTSGYLSAQQVGSDPLDRRLDIWMTPTGSTVPIRSYNMDMTKYLHLIVVNDNFTMFLHLHPVLTPDGHFVVTVRMPFPGLFHLYADGEPRGLGQQVFRFDLNVGHPTYFEPAAVASVAPTLAPPGTITITRDVTERHTVAHVSGYTVQLSANQVTAGSETMIMVHILKHGKPASDLRPYLGAPAHAVFLNAYDLTYVHVHPMPVSRGNMMLHVALYEPGIYKLWLQFQGGSQLIVVPFVIMAEQPR